MMGSPARAGGEGREPAKEPAKGLRDGARQELAEEELTERELATEKLTKSLLKMEARLKDENSRRAHGVAFQGLAQRACRGAR